MSKQRSTSDNYTTTDDPDVVIGKYGVPITKAEFEHANANGYAWKDLHAYADYVGGFAHPITNPVPIHPYYRHYGNGQNISGADVAIIQAKYNNDPKVQAILQRNIAKPEEVPMFSPQDGDIIKQLATKERVVSQDSNRADFGLSQAVAAAKQKQ